VKGLGRSDFQTGLLTAIPYVIGTIGMVAWSQSSDKSGERKWHYIVACTLGAAGLVVTGWLGSTYAALAAVSIATIGIYGSKPSFWPLPSEFLTGTAAAGGIALINSIGNLGGFVGPFMVGWVKDSTGSYEAGLYALAASAIVSALIALVMLPRREPVVMGKLAAH
jgi:ACS family tartrate transporter-like MFS transporter